MARNDEIPMNGGDSGVATGFADQRSMIFDLGDFNASILKKSRANQTPAKESISPLL